ncbi:histidine phosphatase family protein [uncultured Roseovarius sp.]|uniref:SixA phosphatase family protein n=1 Tax=uncultured Roseovarius sp. TaxID=293344 RepID=UPI0026107296|nr:histidine phosphatase family protein [uncultured Roseovarius sp.]
MTLRLILMRHAKSSWDNPRQADHDRPLNKRGRRSAEALGDWLRARNVIPGLALSSTSERTRATFERLRLPCPVEYLPGLYHAEPREMMGALRGARHGTVLMLGHNPGIAEFAARLVSVPPAHGRFHDYPTCATLIAEFPQSQWSDICYSSAHPVDFTIPRELVQHP